LRFLEPAVGRSSLLSSQPDQPVVALVQCDQLLVRLCAGVYEPGRGCIDWLACRDDDPANWHFFFEPKGYDEVNHATHEYKEKSRLGTTCNARSFNDIWALSPLVLLLDPTLFGIFNPHISDASFIQKVALMWLFIGAAGLIYRTVQLFFIRDVETGLAWRQKS